MSAKVNGSRRMTLSLLSQRSEVLNRATCHYCLSVDGRVIQKDDPFAQNTICQSNR